MDPKCFFYPNIFDQNFLKISFGPTIFFRAQHFFALKCFLDPKFLWTQKFFFGPKFFWGPIFFCTKIFVDPKIFWIQLFFCNFVFTFVGVVQLIYDLKFLDTKFLLTQNFITKNFFRPKKFSDLFYFLDHFVWPQNFSDKKSSLNSFQAEHYRLKSCLFNIPKHLYNLLNLQYFAIYIYNLLNLSLYVFKRICICCISG